MTSTGSVIRWTALALAGLAIAAAVAFAASHLVSQRIGLAAQPLDAGRELAPPSAVSHERNHGRPPHRGGDGSTSTTTPTATAPSSTTFGTTPPAVAPTTPSPSPSDGSAGESSGPDD